MRLGNEIDGAQRPVPRSESVAELFYARAPRPFFSLQPNPPYLRHPGGVGSNDAVLVVGLPSSVDS